MVAEIAFADTKLGDTRMKLTWCTLAAMVACGCGSEPPITPLGDEDPTTAATPDQATSPIARPGQAATRPEKTEPTSNVTSAGEPVPGFNLSLVTGFDDRVIAIADMADDADLATVDELADWSLNQ